MTNDLNKGISVSQLNKLLKDAIEQNHTFSNLFVFGELSNVKYHPVGHIYFTLKDENSRINGMIFSRVAKNIDFRLEDGQKVIILGNIGVYEQGGTYNINVNRINLDGIGKLYQDFEQLKKELAQKGYFSLSYKKALPKFPRTVVVLGASHGAAIHDIITIMQRRFPPVKIIVIDTVMQGNKSSSDVINKLVSIKDKKIDLIIIARGGGSFEDLNSFNDRQLAELVFHYPIPIISAIGHETDFTILDWVADKRAATPSEAAELATPSVDELKQTINEYQNKIKLLSLKQYDLKQNRYLNLANNNYFKNPESLISLKQLNFHRLETSFGLLQKEFFNRLNQDINNKNNKLNELIKQNLREKEVLLENNILRLDLLSPLNTLKRGYVVSKQDHVIKSRDDIDFNKPLTLIYHDGAINLNIKE